MAELGSENYGLCLGGSVAKYTHVCIMHSIRLAWQRCQTTMLPDLMQAGLVPYCRYLAPTLIVWLLWHLPKIGNPCLRQGCVSVLPVWAAWQPETGSNPQNIFVVIISFLQFYQWMQQLLLAVYRVSSWWNAVVSIVFFGADVLRNHPPIPIVRCSVCLGEGNSQHTAYMYPIIKC